MIKHPTYFVDIDGTLIKYRKFTEINEVPPTPIQSVIDKVNDEYNNGAYVVITTARPIELELFTKQELEKIGIKYHQLVMGIGRGTRYIINDKDPEAPEVDRAVGINLNRNEGLCM
jgi:histidinol phosphatase-like enzyme